MSIWAAIFDLKGSRVSRWIVLPAASTVFGALSLEKASHSYYEVPAYEQLKSISGTLELPPGLKVKNWSIQLLSRDGTLHHFKCDPNDRWTIHQGCLTAEKYEKLAGEPVTLRYFFHRDAKYHPDVVMEMRTASGDVIIPYEVRKAKLLTAQQYNRRVGWENSIVSALVIALSVSLLFEIHVRTTAWGKAYAARKANRNVTSKDE